MMFVTIVNLLLANVVSGIDGQTGQAAKVLLGKSGASDSAPGAPKFKEIEGKHGHCVKSSGKPWDREPDSPETAKRYKKTKFYLRKTLKQCKSLCIKNKSCKGISISKMWPARKRPTKLNKGTNCILFLVDIKTNKVSSVVHGGWRRCYYLLVSDTAPSVANAKEELDEEPEEELDAEPEASAQGKNKITGCTPPTHADGVGYQCQATFEDKLDATLFYKCGGDNVEFMLIHDGEKWLAGGVSLDKMNDLYAVINDDKEIGARHIEQIGRCMETGDATKNAKIKNVEMSFENDKRVSKWTVSKELWKKVEYGFSVAIGGSAEFGPHDHDHRQKYTFVNPCPVEATTTGEEEEEVEEEVEEKEEEPTCDKTYCNSKAECEVDADGAKTCGVCGDRHTGDTCETPPAHEITPEEQEKLVQCAGIRFPSCDDCDWTWCSTMSMENDTCEPNQETKTCVPIVTTEEPSTSEIIEDDTDEEPDAALGNVEEEESLGEEAGKLCMGVDNTPPNSCETKCDYDWCLDEKNEHPEWMCVPNKKKDGCIPRGGAGDLGEIDSAEKPEIEEAQGGAGDLGEVDSEASTKGPLSADNVAVVEPVKTNEAPVEEAQGGAGDLGEVESEPEIVAQGDGGDLGEINSDIAEPETGTAGGEGNLGEIGSDKCSPNPCKHEGKCVPSSDDPKGYKCECNLKSFYTHLYTGEHCDEKRKICDAGWLKLELNEECLCQNRDDKKWKTDAICKGHETDKVMCHRRTGKCKKNNGSGCDQSSECVLGDCKFNQMKQMKVCC